VISPAYGSAMPPIRRLQGKVTIPSVALVVTLSMVACGGSNPAKQHPTRAAHATAIKTPLTEPVTAQVIARDRALGERALLRESDFSNEYAAVPRGGHEPPQEENATHLLQKAATCTLSERESTRSAPLNASALAQKNPATVSEEVGEVGESSKGPGGYVKIESTVTVEATVAAAREWFSILEQTQMASCIAEAERAFTIQDSPGLLKPGNSVGKARVTQLTLPRYGDQTVGYRLTFPITAEGHSFSHYLDFVLVRKGRAHVMLTFGRVFFPVSSTMERRLTALTARRLRA
jgi:hypothetical protein